MELKYVIVTDYHNGNKKSRLYFVSKENNIEIWTANINEAKTFTDENVAKNECILNNIFYAPQGHFKGHVVPVAFTKASIDKTFNNIIADMTSTTTGDPEIIADAIIRSKHAYSKLREREQIVLTLVMYGFSYETIGKMYNRTGQRIAGIHKIAELRFEIFCKEN